MVHRGVVKKPQKGAVPSVLTEKHWKSLVYHNWNNLVDELAKSLIALNEKAQVLGVVPEYLYIHYLRTSVCNKSPFFRLDYFDEQKWNGNTDCWIYWDAGTVTDMLYTRMPCVVEKHISDCGRKEAELEAERLACADILHGIMQKMIQALLSDAILKSSFDVGDIPVFYGEYMGAAKNLKI